MVNLLHGQVSMVNTPEDLMELKRFMERTVKIMEYCANYAQVFYYLLRKNGRGDYSVDGSTINDLQRWKNGCSNNTTLKQEYTC